MKIHLISTILVVGGMLAASGANADSKIGGDATIDSEAKNVTCAAIGSKNNCEIHIASVVNSEVGGDLSIDSKVGNVTAVATGTGNSAVIDKATIR